MAESIKEEPYVEDVKIKRQLPGTVQITIKERKPEYQINVIDGFIVIDYQGYILENISDKLNIPLLEGLKTSQEDLLNKKRISEKDIDSLNVFLKIVQVAKNLEVYDKISKIIIENNEYVLYFEGEEKFAYLGNGNDITNKMQFIKIILEKESGKAGKIFVDGDLNSGFKAYFRENINNSET